MKITVLIENESTSVLTCEHGLSLFIESENDTIILDAGKSGAVIDNAKRLGINLKKADFAVLSHGHYDHADGFLAILNEIPNLMVYANSRVRKNYFSGREGKIHYIGINKELLKKYESQFQFFDDTIEIAHNIFAVVHQKLNYQNIAEHACLFMEDNNTLNPMTSLQTKRFLHPDDFFHEITLVIREHSGLYIFNSCSHVGVPHVIEEVKAYFPNEKIVGFIGGFHFLGKEIGRCSFTREEVHQFAAQLLEAGVENIYTGHCTGEEGFNWLQEILGNRLVKICSGTMIQ